MCSRPVQWTPRCVRIRRAECRPRTAIVFTTNYIYINIIPIHTQNYCPRNGPAKDLYGNALLQQVPGKYVWKTIDKLQNTQREKERERASAQTRRRYIVTDLLRLIFFINELVIIPIFCKTKFSECSARLFARIETRCMKRSRGSVTILLSKNKRAFQELVAASNRFPSFTELRVVVVVDYRTINNAEAEFELRASPSETVYY